MCKKTTCLDQRDQIGGVQQEQNRAENRPLRYTAHDQRRRRCRGSGSNVLAPADQERLELLHHRSRQTVRSFQSPNKDVVIHRVEGRGEVQQHQCRSVAGIDVKRDI